MKKELLEYLRDVSEGKSGLWNDTASAMCHCVEEQGKGTRNKDIGMGQGKLIDMCIQPHGLPVLDHSHNYVELVYMYGGSTVHVINETRILRLEPNDLLLLKQGTVHAAYPADDEAVAVHFFLMPEIFFHPELTAENESILHHFITRPVIGDHCSADYLHFHLQDMLPAQNLLENIIWSMSGDKKGRQEINLATMGILIMELFHNGDKTELHDPAQYEEKIAINAYQYLVNNYTTATLEEFAAMSMQPTYYISRLFKRHFQVTFTECLQLIRMIRAANYLSSTAKPVEEIIAEIGYENSSYFHRLFKERYGMTPKQYRDKSKE